MVVLVALGTVVYVGQVIGHCLTSWSGDGFYPPAKIVAFSLKGIFVSGGSMLYVTVR